MLPFIALFLVALMGVATLVVDLGLASFSQAAMQVAADGAAMEGLRQRDDVPGDPVASDAQRRDAAATLVRRLFDDDLLASPGDAIGLGAGPQLGLVAQGPVAGASSLLVIGADPLWKPQLQPNLENLVHGDLVAGSYDPAAAHVEADDYERPDFAAADTPDAPGAPAFLARLRRTNDALGLDAQDGVSSTGPTLPMLFGHGAFLHGEPGGYDPAVDGFTLRATAIASARVAIAVGPATAATSGQGAIGWSLHQDVWQSQPVGVPLVLDVDAGTGALTLPGGGATVGTACALVLGAGQPITPAAPGSLPDQGWIAVSTTGIDGQPRDLAFGPASLAPSGTGGVSIVKQPGLVAPLDASAVATGMLPPLDPAALQQLFDAVAALPLDPSAGYVLAPALVR